jgi:hypothetical protein
MKRKAKSLFLKAVETGDRYAEAVRLHSVMHRALDEDRNLQAGKVYDLAGQFRDEMKALDAHVEEIVARNEAFRSIVRDLDPVLKAAAGADLRVAGLVAGLAGLMGEEEAATPASDAPSTLAAPMREARELDPPPAQISLDL